MTNVINHDDKRCLIFAFSYAILKLLFFVIGAGMNRCRGYCLVVLRLLLALAFIFSLTTPAMAAGGITTLVSVNSSGEQRSGEVPVISADGRYVAFISSDSNLVPGDTNGLVDVFVHDRQTGTTRRVSVSSSGVQGNGISNSKPSISANGRYIVFDSNATNLVAGDHNPGVYLHDCQTGATTRIAIHSIHPSISADGRYVAFSSDRSLVSGDTNDTFDVFVYDRQANVTTRVSVSSSGTEGNGQSAYPVISADGRYVAFVSWADNLVANDTNNATDIFVHDRQTGITTRVSVDSSGDQGNDYSGHAAISADGRYVAFDSSASNLVTGDTNGVYDIFIHDLQTARTMRISVGLAGRQANGDSFEPSLSADGRYVAFPSLASNLVTGDTNGPYFDVFVFDRQTKKTILASISSSGVQGNAVSIDASISADGQLVAFESFADNLVTGDTNSMWDVFVHEPDWSPIASTPTLASDPKDLPSTGFPFGKRTALLEQPIQKAYTSTDLTLEIPALGVKMPIVGVPQTGDSWDVTWLGNSAGWLEGSAFPTWAGNTMLTGHVWDAQNRPGPFANLKNLKYGDKVNIRAWGSVYTYEVRESALVLANDLKTVLKHEEYSWVTLVTCESYNSIKENYRYRRVVRAVLISVK
jgi:LPXTG-site transpeptidase (sortase) family protein